MSRINIRAKDENIKLLNDLVVRTNSDSQAKVIVKSLHLLNDVLDIKEQFKGDLDDTLALAVFAKLMFNKVEE